MAQERDSGAEGSSNAEKCIVVTRFFHAPRERVWRAWTEARELRRWWGPKDFSSPDCKVDLRVGGRYLFCMRSPDGQDFWSAGTYSEIVPPSRLVCTDTFSDEKGNPIPASQYGMEGDWPPELLVKITLEERGDETKLTLTHEGIPTRDMRDLTAAGWKESFNKLAAVLS
jgi:uncharacterized protein YndB with AHSA1/START domain